jgi:hypothetical protein
MMNSAVCYTNVTRRWPKPSMAYEAGDRPTVNELWRRTIVGIGYSGMEGRLIIETRVWHLKIQELSLLSLIEDP